jgi:nitrate reductase NapE component
MQTKNNDIDGRERKERSSEKKKTELIYFLYIALFLVSSNSILYTHAFVVLGL